MKTTSVEYSLCPDVGEHTIKDICIFLAEYCAWLLGCGATCIRMERNVDRIASALGCDVVMTILPRHVHLSVTRRANGDIYTYITATRKIPINFDMNTRLSELSWAMSDGRVTYPEMVRRFHQIINTPTTNRFLVLFLASLANAAFCRIFSGDWYACGVVFLSTFVGFALKQILAIYKVDVRIIMIICAFVSSVLAANATIFSIGLTPAIAIGTSVLYLVPGIPFLNSFSDMLDGHYICAFSRFIHAAVLTCCLSLGLCCGMLLMNIGMF